MVLQNDLDFARSATARPSDLEILTDEPGLEREASFGAPGENVPGSAPLGPRDRALAARERRLPPVQVLRLTDPVPATRAEPGPPLVVSGDGFGLPPTIASGLLGGNQPFVYSGGLTPAQLSPLAADHAGFVITDSNRRRTWNFSGVRDNFSATLPADQGGTSVGYNLFGGRIDTQTVARFIGVRDVGASSSGTGLAQQPWLQAANAFDGDPDTAWGVSGFASPVGQWVEVRFDRAIRIGQLTIDPYVGRSGSRQLSRIALRFSDGSVVTRDVGPRISTIEFASRPTRSLRIEVAGIRPGPFGGLVGLKEVSIPGVSVREALQLPSDLLHLVARVPDGASMFAAAPLAYVFDRGRTNGQRSCARPFA